MSISNTTLQNKILRIKSLSLLSYLIMFLVTILLVDSDTALLNQLVLQLGSVISDLSPQEVKP